jgi:hypothetical protein
MRTLLVLLLCGSLGAAGELQTLTGKILTGDLASLSDKVLVFKTTKGDVSTPVSEVLTVALQNDSALPAGTKYADLELVDGTMLHCSKYALKGKDFEVTLAGSELKTKLPLAVVAALLNDAQDPAVRKEWQEKVVAKRGNQDVVAIKLNDSLNSLDGTFGDSGNAKGELSFEYEIGGERQKKDLDLSKAQGLLFLRSLPATAPSPLCKVFDTHQGVYVVSKLSLSGDNFTLALVAGPSLVLPRKIVARLDYSNDKVVFLSDLKPTELIEKSRQGRKEPMRLNKNLDNGPIRVGVTVYSRGLAIHAYTDATYTLDGKYQKFDAVLGMDADVLGDGKPVVTIEADGKQLFSATVTRKDQPRSLSLPVKGAKQLRIVVASTGLFDFGDHVDLANAKLSK